MSAWRPGTHLLEAQLQPDLRRSTSVEPRQRKIGKHLERQGPARQIGPPRQNRYHSRLASQTGRRSRERPDGSKHRRSPGRLRIGQIEHLVGLSDCGSLGARIGAVGNILRRPGIALAAL
jgi:hypothetical protein